MADLTCDRCLDGDPWRCRGRGKCANASVAKSYGKRTGRASSRKEGVGTPRFKSPWAIDDGPKPKPAKIETEIPAPDHLRAAIREMSDSGMSVEIISRRLTGEQGPSRKSLEEICE